MDPVSTALIAGLTAGVTGGLTEAGKKLISDAYDALKTALQQKCGIDSDLAQAIEHLEKKPEAKSRQEGVVEEVRAIKADQDPEILTAAKSMLETLESIPTGKQVLAKFQIDAPNSQIGVIGENIEIKGGINFGKRRS